MENDLMRSVVGQVSGLFQLFDKDGNGRIDKNELRQAIPLLEDLTRVFKRVDNVFQAKEAGGDAKSAPNATDANAPIPTDGSLGIYGRFCISGHLK